MSLNPEAIRPLRGLSLAVLTGLAAATTVSLVGVVINAAKLADVVPPAIGGSMLDRAETLTDVADALTLVITGVLFIIWLYVARRNAEAATGTVHRRHKAWIVFGWFTPIVNLWFPMQVVDDIWIASHPKTRDGGPDPLHPGRPTIIFTWWISYLLSGALFSRGAWILRRSIDRSWADPDPPIDPSDLFAASAVINMIAGIQLIYIVHKITQFQEARRSRHQQAMVMDTIDRS